ncbi:MAG: hypothetical protein HETSPECPRED_006924 [Heterodermia speciosa]|uniref:Uncharacterized protein n=1 Tax=Heterodermia speciosa TaxID=116794 RepID=A0A8H3IVS0_9LECA|nr:MAG: hypothetical protein HETSPECPRED_006924 [Heterodermia speciosa]
MSSTLESPQETILAPLDAANLEKLGVVSKVSGGKRKISSSTWSLVSTTSTPFTSSSEDEQTIEIPEVLRSKETYIFLGLSEKLATILWKRWLNIDPDDRGPDGPISFLSLAETIVACHNEDLWCINDPWINYITALGFSDEIAAAICDPKHDSIRFTASAKFWLLDTLNLRWRSLQDLQDKSRSRLRKAQSKKADTSEADTSVAIRGGGDQAMNPNFVPGSTILWRGSDNRYVQNLIHPITGEVDMYRMRALWPNDFGSILKGGSGYYFSPQKAVALKYAAFARKRSESSATSLVRIEIPNSILEKYKPVLIEHDTSEMWRIVVWHSRQLRTIPKAYSHLKSAAVLIGPICRSENTAIEKLATWKDITNGHIMMVEKEVWNENENVYESRSRRGIQYVFNGDEIQLDLETNCKWELQSCSYI